jgi:hypothetical protein
MRLTDLSPKWLLADGRRMGIVLRCPHCPDSGTWLSCFFVPMPHIAGEDYHECQYALFRTVLDEDITESHDIVPCKQNYAWTCIPPVDQATFESMSVQPSLDASASGHWHGHITNGMIV